MSENESGPVLLLTVEHDVEVSQYCDQLVSLEDIRTARWLVCGVCAGAMAGSVGRMVPETLEESL
jgi:hypothetical protein